eukprot:CAMPEP_0119514196 /NCGR_PEP_ID=MMETSP1344-20130328/32088_1 /TAXON_ID=236787 /ORGANISM="Florenciella parvula, Strain CCMP2471" /LENGTH=83 /DNA_ID=CAMNT_0007551501 /DNA_START=153 /DNA_END=402 /DNA_ORIENTATION=-
MITALLSGWCAIVVVRAKDRFNDFNSFGYRDFLLNVRLQDGTHVGELQLHLKAMHAFKPAIMPQADAILWQVGWEDLELEDND